MEQPLEQTPEQILEEMRAMDAAGEVVDGPPPVIGEAPAATDAPPPPADVSEEEMKRYALSLVLSDPEMRAMVQGQTAPPRQDAPPPDPMEQYQGLVPDPEELLTGRDALGLAMRIAQGEIEREVAPLRQMLQEIQAKEAMVQAAPQIAQQIGMADAAPVVQEALAELGPDALGLLQENPTFRKFFTDAVRARAMDRQPPAPPEDAKPLPKTDGAVGAAGPKYDTSRKAEWERHFGHLGIPYKEGL